MHTWEEAPGEASLHEAPVVGEEGIGDAFPPFPSALP